MTEYFRRYRPPDRPGSPVSFLDVRRRFDFRAIEIGRWVTEAERQRAAEAFYRALCDLMMTLQGPEVLISLRGTLALKYGTGGQPGVAAHYAPATRTFALAKNAGAGSIAHEWFHAFDHYICDKSFQDTASGVFGSRAWLDEACPVAHPLNQRLFACYKAVLLSASGAEPSDLFRHSASQDEQLGVFYYSRPEEMCARAFEAFVQDKGPGNTFLVAGSLQSGEARLGLYPMGAQRRRINEAFTAYFSSLGQALSRRA